ncbi:uncharacterized protein EAE97_006223 [Botrytis byssoidea]|uniref:Uncharacterized protein n=1 Tax=Botrytis byssoidea TaxID=139641 RepID=A0A9P5IQ94_9HELO|nr:uncharacterized protein EAE97_006223 [Botrytis byssoidea]KAF7942769.1 hypothetical protein EAE97_006223 [Botrytis byssoidea]
MNASAGKLKLKPRQSRSPPDGHVPDLPVPNHLPRLASLPRLSSHGASGLPSCVSNGCDHHSVPVICSGPR